MKIFLISLALVMSFVSVSCVEDGNSKKGGIGESCTKSSDCNDALRCIDLICVDNSGYTVNKKVALKPQQNEHKQNLKLQEEKAQKPNSTSSQNFSGANFAIVCPSGFTVKPSLKSSIAGKYDSVLCVSPDRLVEFYAFASGWEQEASKLQPQDIAFNPASEKKSSPTGKDSVCMRVTFYTITDKNNKYSRSYQETVMGDEGTYRAEIVGIKYTNKVSYKKYKKAYLAFKKSFKFNLEPQAENATKIDAALKKSFGNWSNPAPKKMSWSEANKYCENLVENGSSDWRLPTISELRTLIKNCPATETGGACKLTKDCLSYNDCRKNACDGCGSDNPGKYSVFGDIEGFWSSSEQSDLTIIAWSVYFANGGVYANGKNAKYYVRCVH